MSISGRRFEILLPLRFNDGKAVPDDFIGDALVELRTKFGAVSSETQRIEGQWQHAGQVYRDELMRIFVDVQDTQQNRDFFRLFRERIRVRFQQVAIWMTSHPIDIE
jgi:hypothetical protein